MEMREIPLDQIVAGNVINSRRTGRDKGIAELAASIAEHGLLQPLLARRIDDGRFEIVAGNRRFQAIKLLAKDKRMAADQPVPCLIGNRDDADALEASLAENIMRLPPHPVDQYEAFAIVAKEQGFDATAIAMRFGTTKRHVEQMMALGDLHPEIREAWRQGEIRDDCAKAFTLARGDQDRQKKLFDKLRKNGQMWPDAVRSAIAGRMSDHGLPVAAAIDLIGADAYRAAGGQIIEDLFERDPVVSDIELLKKLVGDRIAAECEKIVAEEGWGWAIAKPQADWQWQRKDARGKPTPEERKQLEAILARMSAIADLDTDMSAEESEEYDGLEADHAKIMSTVAARAFSPKMKKTLGCFVSLERDGLQIEKGLIRPEDAKAAEREKAKKEKEKAAKAAGERPGEDRDLGLISNALAIALSEQRTIALARALEAFPVIALAAATAALGDRNSFYSPLKFRVDGYHAAAIEQGDDRVSFADDLRGLIDLGMDSTDALVTEFAQRVAGACDLRLYNAQAKRGEGEIELLKAIPSRFKIEALKAFDRERYFAGINGDQRAAIAKELAPDATFPKRKADQIEALKELAEAAKWLPPELRPPKEG